MEMTALHWAIRHYEIELAKRLCEKEPNRGNESLWHHSIVAGLSERSEAAVQLLLAAGADANTKLASGETVLMTAARTGRVAVVSSLVAAVCERQRTRSQAADGAHVGRSGR